jgi:hypothetical protein
MKTLATTLLFTLLFFNIPVMAEIDHDHGHSHSQIPVDKATAEINATKAIAALVANNTIDKSWATITASSVEQKEFEGLSEWMAIFINDKITETEKQKLYVFLTLEGHYIAANYTGN